MTERSRPQRLHHNAAVARDLTATRAFYTDILGLPHVMTWCERTADGHDYCHAFFELEDGSWLAFFQFAEEAEYEKLKRPESLSNYHHVALAADEATQQDMARRAEAAGLAAMFLDHGYCRSLYLQDPDGHIVEITVDDPRVLESAAKHRMEAHDALERWLGGDHRDTNVYRPEAPDVPGH